MDNRSPDGESYADSTATFPQKLFAMMEIEDGDVVHWAPHGFAFVVTNQDKFLNEIVPKYFKHTKLTSFQRQLNLYGFRRLSKGEDQGAYFHPKFQRNRKEMMAEIKRLQPKGSLQSLEQVMNANRQLPSERFGGTKRRTAKGTGKPGKTSMDAKPTDRMGGMGTMDMGMGGMDMDMDMGMGMGMDSSFDNGQINPSGFFSQARYANFHQPRHQPRHQPQSYASVPRGQSQGQRQAHDQGHMQGHGQGRAQGQWSGQGHSSGQGQSAGLAEGTEVAGCDSQPLTKSRLTMNIGFGKGGGPSQQGQGYFPGHPGMYYGQYSRPSQHGPYDPFDMALADMPDFRVPISSNFTSDPQGGYVTLPNPHYIFPDGKYAEGRAQRGTSQGQRDSEDYDRSGSCQSGLSALARVDSSASFDLLDFFNPTSPDKDDIDLGLGLGEFGERVASFAMLPPGEKQLPKMIRGVSAESHAMLSVFEDSPIVG